MPPPPERIYDVCGQLLAAVEARHGAPLPARRYISAGAPAWDCDLLATWCERTAGTAGTVAQEAVVVHTAEPTHAMRYGLFVVTLVRCTPAVPDADGQTVTLPTVEDEDGAARTLYEDAQRMLNALVAANKAGELPGCHSVAFVDWRTVGPDGGYVAGELRVRVGLSVGT